MSPILTRMIGAGSAGSGFGFGRRRNVGGGPYGTFDNPAPSATALKASGVSTNDSYWYSFSGGVTRELYTDLTTYSNYPMVLATNLSSADHNQYFTTENNQFSFSFGRSSRPWAN